MDRACCGVVFCYAATIERATRSLRHATDLEFEHEFYELFFLSGHVRDKWVRLTKHLARVGHSFVSSLRMCVSVETLLVHARSPNFMFGLKPTWVTRHMMACSFSFR